MADWWDHVEVASTAADGSINTLAPPSTIDGVATSTFTTTPPATRVLLKHQGTASQNRVYVWTAGTPNFLQATADVQAPRATVRVNSGATQAKTEWSLVDTTNYVWARQEPRQTVMDSGARGNGTTNDATALTTATTASNALVYPAGTYVIGANTSLGSAGHLHEFQPGAKLYVNSGVTLTITGRINAHPQQLIFDGPGTVAFVEGSPDTIHVGWFGARGDSSVDDAIGITKACTAGGARGLTIAFHDPPSGNFFIRSPIVIGTTTTTTQSVRWKLPRAGGYSGTSKFFQCDASMNAGAPMLLIQNAIHVDLDGASFNAQGNADYCIQIRNDYGQQPSWHCVIQQATVMGARVHNILSGEAQFFATASGGTLTATAGAGGAAASHPLVVADTVYFWKEVDTAVLPTNVIQSATYTVATVPTANTFTLTGVTPTGGAGRWLVCKVSGGDCSQLLVIGTQFSNHPTSSVTTSAHFAQSGSNTLGSRLESCWFQGSMLAAATFTVPGGVVTPAGSWSSTNGVANGDIVLVWRSGSTDVLPTPLQGDTEYYVRDYNSGTGAFNLASAPGGTALGLGSMTGTCKIVKLRFPRYSASVQEGRVSLAGCSATGLYVDLFITGRVGGQGATATVDSIDSQSWRLLRATTRSMDFAPQIGGVALINCTHSNISSMDGSRASVDWDYGAYAPLLVAGGYYNRDIKIAAGSSPVRIAGPALVTYGSDSGFQASVKGTLTNVTGDWTESGVTVARIVGTLTYGGNATLTGTVTDGTKSTRTDVTTYSGNNAMRDNRFTTISIAATGSVNIDAWKFDFIGTTGDPGNGNTRTWRLTAPPNNEHCLVYLSSTSITSTGVLRILDNASGTLIGTCQFPGAKHMFFYDGTTWTRFMSE